ncbi:hypothetical protein JCM8547_009365 [Rhodosporidiobolus lusitaniae]
MAFKQPAQSAQRKRNLVPVALVLEPSASCDHILAPYCTAVISALQALHPQTQLVLTAVTPSSHAIPLNPFLPPAAFLAALPSFVRRPARPASTLWRSTTGLLRAIKLARRRLLEGGLAGAGGEGRGQLPKYVVVVSATDVQNLGGDEVWLEDDDHAETWESVAKNFTRGPHCTTLFSLISLGHTPNLEAFWKESCGRFPPNLIYNSTAPPPSSGVSFPLVSPSHACFLIGFYNSNNRSSSQATAAPSPAANANKRAAPPDAATANKKAKPNPPTLPGTSMSPQLANANLATKPPVPPNPSRTPAQPLANLQTSPNLQPKPSPAMPTLPGGALTNENLQQYINDMKTAARNAGRPPPSQSEIQAAALAVYANGSVPPRNGSGAPGSTGPSSQPLPRSTPKPDAPAPLLPLNQMTAQQMNALPQLPQEMRVKIETHLASVRQKVKNGEMNHDEATSQIGKLQEYANRARYDIASKKQAAEAAAAAPTTGDNSHGQGLGLNIPLAPGLQSAAPPPSPNRQPAQQPQRPAPPPRQDSNNNPLCWRGSISWAFSSNETGGAPAEFTMYCQAAPMQASAVRDLAGVKFPSSFRISQLVQIKMQALQAMAHEHTLPAITITPIPADILPKELQDKQRQTSGGHTNEQLYTMLASSIEARSNCGIVRFSGTPNGLVLVAIPGQAKLLGLVFTKISLPEAWNKAGGATNDLSSLNPQHQRTPSQQPSFLPPPQQQQQQQPPVQRPTSAQSGMFSSPVPFNLQLPPQPQQPGSAQPPSSTMYGTPSQIQHQAMPMFVPMAQQQQQPPQHPPPPPMDTSVAGMDFAELQRLLGPEQFAAIMSGV